MAISKPSKSGSLCHNYKGFFCIVRLALVDAKYRYTWVQMGGHSDAHIFNDSRLRDQIYPTSF